MTIDPPTALTVTIDSGNQSVNSILSESNATLSLSGGSLAVAAGAEIDGSFQLNGNLALSGMYSGGASSTAQFSAGNVNAGGSTVLDFPSFDWTGGTFGGSLTNTVTITLSGSSQIFLSGALSNSGTIIDSGTGSLVLGTAGSDSNSPGTLNNLASGVIDLQAGASIVDLETFYTALSVVNNAGEVEVAAGSASAAIETSYINNTGSVEVDSGTLSLGYAYGSTITSNGGSFTTESDATLDFFAPNIAVVGSGYQLVFSGTFTGAGAGLVEFADDGNFVAGSPGATLDFTDFQWTAGTIGGSLNNQNSMTWSGGTLAGTLTNSGAITWTGGTIAGTLTNSGTIAISGANSEYVAGGTLANAGTIVEEGPGNLSLGIVTTAGFGNEYGIGGTLSNLAGGTLDLQDDAGITSFQGTLQSPPPPVLNNAGTLRTSAGDGTSTIIVSTFNNSGTVEVDSGTLAITATVSQVSESSLSGGTWNVLGGSTLDITTAGTITTNDAAVTLSGTGANFPFVNSITSNAESLIILDGADLAMIGDLTNQSSLNVGAGSTLSVNGNFTQLNSASLAIQVGGTPASGQFGQVTASGNATLGGTLSISLVNGFAPQAGDHFQIMTYGSGNGAFPLIDGLTAGRTQLFELVTSDTDVAVNALVDAGDLAVQSVSFTAPNNAESGQDVTINYTVINNESTPTSADSWVDSIYLSPDDYYDSSARLIGQAQHTGALAGGASYTGTLIAPLPGIVPGNYHIFVICDSQGDVPDVNRANNTLAAPNLITVGMESLAPGVTASGTIDDGQDEYYQVNLPAGPVVTITADFAAAAGASCLSGTRMFPTRRRLIRRRSTRANRNNRSP